MNNKVQQQLIDLYMKKCINPCPTKNAYHSLQVNTLESININNTGFLRLNITDKVTAKSVLNATITLYVTDGANRDIPIMHIITTLNAYNNYLKSNKIRITHGKCNRNSISRTRV